MLADYLTLGKFGLAVASYMSWETGLIAAKAAWLDSSKNKLAFFPRVYAMQGALGSLGLAAMMCYPIASTITEVASAFRFAMLIVSCIFWEIGIVAIMVTYREGNKLKMTWFGRMIFFMVGLCVLGLAFVMCYPSLNEYGVIDFIYQEASK